MNCPSGETCRVVHLAHAEQVVDAHGARLFTLLRVSNGTNQGKREQKQHCAVRHSDNSPEVSTRSTRLPRHSARFANAGWLHLVKDSKPAPCVDCCSGHRPPQRTLFQLQKFSTFFFSSAPTDLVFFESHLLFRTYSDLPLGGREKKIQYSIAPRTGSLRVISHGRKALAKLTLWPLVAATFLMVSGALTELSP